MSTPQGSNDDSDVVETFKEALKQRVGQERFQIWFSEVRIDVENDPQDQRPMVLLVARGQFAADRLTNNYLSAIRGAASAALGPSASAKITFDHLPAKQIDLPLGDSLSEGEQSDRNGNANGSGVETKRPASSKDDPSSGRASNRRINGKRHFNNKTQSLGAILHHGTDSRKRSDSEQPTGPGRATAASAPAAGPSAPTKPANAVAPKIDCSWESFIPGPCNELARTACQFAIESPQKASPLVLWGPAGSGKTHLLEAVASKLRRVHRMRRVTCLSAEEFTNDFIKSLHSNCLPAFRSRFRDVDALLIDDVQFFGDKKATVRELHHTIEMLAEVGKPLVLAGTKSPAEIRGLGGELSGRLAAGLVCQVESLDPQTRKHLLTRYAADRCTMPWPEEVIDEIASTAEGDGRLLSGIVNLVNLLQRMNGTMPSIDLIRQHGGHLLRATGVPVTLSAIERAVEKVFQLDSKSLQSGSQTKTVTEPRMLAMYLSRELTSSAYSEIGSHYGGRSHSTAILANQRVRQWLDSGRAIGRGQSAVAADEAIRRIEAILKTA